MSPARVPRLVAAVLAAVLIGDFTSVALRASHHAPVPLAASRRSPARTNVHGRPVPATSRDAGSVSGEPVGVRAVLAQRAAAILAHDRHAFLATVDPHAPPRFRRAQGAVFGDLAAVPFGTWSYEIQGWDPRPLAQASARARAAVYAPNAVVARYALRRFDTRATALVQYYAFVDRGGRWFIRGQRASGVLGHADRDIWDFGRVVVASTRDVLVLGHPGAEPLMQTIAAEVHAAIPRVDAVWGTDWSRRVVALVPRSTGELNAILGGSADLSQIAAVASAEVAEDGLPADDTGDRVAINPPVFARLSELGRRIVLTHEVTHVASRAATGPLVPAWLVEGLADYVGFRGTGASVDQIAEELRADVLAGRVPAGLPSDAAFAGRDARLAEVYEEAWLACRLIAQRAGERALVRLYRDLGARQGGDPAVALRSALLRFTGMTTRVFLARWRAYVRAQLS